MKSITAFLMTALVAGSVFASDAAPKAAKPDLAKGEAGEELLALIQQETQLDVAASVNKTGAAELAGDWELELQRGQVNTGLPFAEKSLRDFSEVLVVKQYSLFVLHWMCD